MRQKEQLQNTDKRLDEINSNLRVSQKHIQGIKVNIIKLTYINKIPIIKNINL